ncbi:hypothetical protein PAHAL_9G216500 [Panicum hallii]|uniref:Mitochondrial import inner membrane translocase subunit n=1 Tax=Panicum hallii TaxID=206008 RepID=A0A2T8I203_9POAL|nr:hypothetical protein PAHAL_9G216500 [Panicum hallii]
MRHICFASFRDRVLSSLPFLPKAPKPSSPLPRAAAAAAMDKSMLGDLDGLPEEDKMRMAVMIEQIQIRDSLRMYNSLVERCFTDCVDTFRRKTLDKQEESCVRRCAEKFLKHSMRVGMRFAELNQGVATPD